MGNLKFLLCIWQEKTGTVCYSSYGAAAASSNIPMAFKDMLNAVNKNAGIPRKPGMLSDGGGAVCIFRL